MTTAETNAQNNTAPLPQAQANRVVHRRTVFFISGFDPRGASYYYPLYRNEAQKYSQVTGIPLQISACTKTPLADSSWQITATTPETQTLTRYEYLCWDDLIGQHWKRSPLQQGWDIISTTLFNLRHGSLWNMLRLAWPPVFALFTPFVFLCSLLLGGPVLMTLVFPAAASWLGVWFAALLMLGLLGSWVSLGVWLQKKYRLLWPMRSFSFTAKQAQGQLPELEERLNQHARTLLGRVAEAVDDEILIVSHSSGAVMATSMMARALQQDPQLGQRGPTLSFLTLGHWIPLLGCLPQATAFRDELKRLAHARHVDWVDVSAPPDGCCFALVDPVAAFGLGDGRPPKDHPKMVSPRFAEMFEPSDYQRIRKDKLRLHLQYMMAGLKPTVYDYFAITTGSMTLADRFRGQTSIQNFSQFRLLKSWGKVKIKPPKNKAAPGTH